MRLFYENRGNALLVERRNSLAYRRHLHRQIEIVYMVSGKACAYADGKKEHLKEGDVFISFPNTVHYYDNCSDDITIYIAIVPYELFGEYKREFSEFSPESAKVEGVSREVCDMFEHVLATEGKYKNEIVKAFLSAGIGIILGNIKLQKKGKAGENSLQTIISFCCEHYKQNITLDDISESLYISKSRISHIFSEKLNMSFRSYINVLRLNDAEQELISTDKSVTEIALTTGFENVRTFDRAFFKHYGMSPRDFRKTQMRRE